MTQAERFVKRGLEHLVCKLKKSIYGLKQAPRCWNAVLDNFLKYHDFRQSCADQCIYVQEKTRVKTIIAVYVDDLVIVSSSECDLMSVKQFLGNRFKMKHLGDLKESIIALPTTDSFNKGHLTYYCKVILKLLNNY